MGRTSIGRGGAKLRAVVAVQNRANVLVIEDRSAGQNCRNIIRIDEIHEVNSLFCIMLVEIGRVGWWRGGSFRNVSLLVEEFCLGGGAVFGTVNRIT